MFNIRKAQSYDEMMVKLTEACKGLMIAQGKAYVVELYEFNDKFLELQRTIENLKKELEKAYFAMETKEL